MMVIRLFGLFLGAFLFLPSNSAAHVKWFTEIHPERTEIDIVLSPLFITMSFISASCLGLTFIVMCRLANSNQIKRLQAHTFSTKFTNLFLQYGVALAFIVQLTNSSLFAPEFGHPETVSLAFASITILLFSIPKQSSVKIASILLLLLYYAYVIEYGLFHILDYLFYIGIAGYFLVVSTKWEHLKSPFLFITTGFSLCWLAAEKWIYSDMTLNIIELYSVPTFGFEPYLVTLVAAFVEFTIGVSWMMGILNRFFALLFTLVMVVTTLFFGYVELVGHFLIFILMIVFIAQNESTISIPARLVESLKGQVTFLTINFLLILSTFVLVYYRFA